MSLRADLAIYGFAAPPSSPHVDHRPFAKQWADLRHYPSFWYLVFNACGLYFTSAGVQYTALKCFISFGLGPGFASTVLLVTAACGSAVGIISGSYIFDKWVGDNPHCTLRVLFGLSIVPIGLLIGIHFATT